MASFRKNQLGARPENYFAQLVDKINAVMSGKIFSLLLVFTKVNDYSNAA